MAAVSPASARPAGRIRRGASTLAALQVPPARIDEVAALVSDEPGVNHSYLREGDWNLWFVATAPDARKLAASLARIEAATGLTVLSLPLVRAFNIDLGFPLDGPRRSMALDRPADLSVLRPGDAALMQALSTGLSLEPRPFAALARSSHMPSKPGSSSGSTTLARARLLTRVGVIVKHRALAGAKTPWWSGNCPDVAIPAAGVALSAIPGVTRAISAALCQGSGTGRCFA